MCCSLRGLELASYPGSFMHKSLGTRRVSSLSIMDDRNHGLLVSHWMVFAHHMRWSLELTSHTNSWNANTVPFYFLLVSVPRPHFLSRNERASVWEQD